MLETFALGVLGGIAANAICGVIKAIWHAVMAG